MKKIYLVQAEYCVDGEISFEVTPCATKEIADRVYLETCEKANNQSYFADNPDTETNGDEQYLFIRVDNDYYADIHIIESNVVSQ